MLDLSNVFSGGLFVKLILVIILLNIMLLGISCTPNESSGGGGWVLLVFLFIPLTVLGLLIYRYCAFPEEIVWTKEDIENYNKKKAEELGENYEGQDYTDEEKIETPRRYQILWNKLKNKIFEIKEKKREKEEREYLLYKRMKDGDEFIKQLDIKELNDPIVSNNGKVNLEEELDDIEIDDIDIEALLKD